MLKLICKSDSVSLYQRACPGTLEQIIAATPQTCAICNDPGIVNILRGGLNFGLRNALAEVFGRICHTTCFLSAQRARNDKDPESCADLQFHPFRDLFHQRHDRRFCDLRRLGISR